MEDKGLRGVAIAQTALFFFVSIIWTLGENRAELVALIVLAWLIFVLCALKVVCLYAPMSKKYSATFCGLSFAACMALAGAIVALFIVQVGFDTSDTFGLISSMFMLAIIVALMIAEAAAYISGAVSHIEEK